METLKQRKQTKDKEKKAREASKSKQANPIRYQTGSPNQHPLPPPPLRSSPVGRDQIELPETLLSMASQAKDRMCKVRPLLSRHWERWIQRRLWALYGLCSFSHLFLPLSCSSCSADVSVRYQFVHHRTVTGGLNLLQRFCVFPPFSDGSDP